MGINEDLHDAIHYEMGLMKRLWNGTPSWFKNSVANIGGHIGDAFKENCGCK